MRKLDLFKNTVVIFYAQFISLAAGILHFMILARVFSKSEYGSFSQMVTITTLSYVFFSLSLPNSVQYFLAKANTKLDQKKIISQILMLCTFLGIFSILTLYTFFPFIIDFLDNPLLEEVKIPILVIIGFQMISANFEFIFITLNKAKKVVYQKTIYATLKLLIGVVTYIFSWSFITFAYAFSILELLFGIFVIFVVRKEVGKIILIFDKLLIKEILIFSIPLMLSMLVGTINNEFGKLFISKNFGLEQVGEYTILSKELPINIVAIALTSVLLPEIARSIKRKDNITTINLWKKSVEISYMAVIWIIGVLILMAPEVITFLYSDKYLNNISIFIVINIVLLMRITYFGMILRASGNTKAILICALIMLATNISLVYLLSPILGLIGITIALLLSTIIINFIQLFLSTKILECTLKQVFPWSKVIKITLVNLLIGLSMYFLKDLLYQLGIHYFLNIVIISLIWLTVYLIIYYKRFLLLRREMIIDNNNNL